jgi:hypothetical protein
VIASALFYPAKLARADLVSLVHGQPLSIPLDVVQLDDPAPHRAERELAVPFLPGMDDIEVAEARLALRAGSRQVDTEDYKVTANGSQGIFLSLPAPARLRKVELTYTLPAPPPPNLHVVVRAATPANGGFTGGAPLFAEPSFGRPGPMFSPVLAGMSASELGGNRRLLTLPSVLGQAWLIQLAVGTSATELAPQDIVPSVQRVMLDATPRNLSVVLLGDAGEVKLWNNPEALLPDAGEQEVSFTPLASKELAATLARQNASTATASPTLPVRLRFDADTVSAVDITARALVAEYLVRPLGPDRLVQRLAGSPVPLALQAPAGLTPRSSQLRLTVKHLGRELNGASPEPPPAPPGGGVRVDQARQVAAAVVPAPLGGAAAGSVLRLASARLHLAAAEAAEAVLELRADVAGSPGAAAAPPVVRQLAAGVSDWIEFELAEPVAVIAGQAPLWLTLRVNKGQIRWFAVPGPVTGTRVSTDRGQTWGPPDARLMPAGPLLAQVFHVVPGPPAAPEIRVQDGGGVSKATVALTAAPGSGTEWVADGALPAAAHALLGARPGQGKVTTTLQLFSRSALDVTVESLVLRYDPFAMSA